MRNRKLLFLCGVCLFSLFCFGGCGESGSAGNHSGTDDYEPATPAVTTGSVQDASLSVTVSPENASVTNGGVFEGWGTSLCWWANRLGYSDTLAQQAADLFYGENGLRLNIMRYNIGGGDDPSHDHIKRTDSAIPGWLVWDEAKQDYVYDYDADHNQLNVMERCVKAAGKEALVEVFSNSPPYFMTVSGCSSGGTDPNVTNLAADAYEDFAEYLATVADYIQNNLNIPITSVSPMNEPNTNYWSANSEKQEGCHISPGKDQSHLLTATAAAFQKHGLDNILIAASDETEPSKQITAYNTYSEEAKAVVGRLNTHTYGTSGIEKLGELARKENINLWMSEVDGGETAGMMAKEMGSALWIGNKIISDINALSPSAWVMWQVIDNHISREGYNGRKDSGMVNLNSGFWGAAVADHNKETIVLTQKYYGIGQFTRYIRPGSTIIHCGDSALAAYEKESQELTVVVINTQRKETACTIDLSAFQNVGSSVKVIRTSGSMEKGEHWAELPDITTADKKIQTTMPGNSITTLIISGVTQ